MSHFYMVQCVYRQSYRQADRQTDRQTDRQSQIQRERLTEHGSCRMSDDSRLLRWRQCGPRTPCGSREALDPDTWGRRRSKRVCHLAAPPVQAPAQRITHAPTYYKQSAINIDRLWT